MAKPTITMRQFDRSETDAAINSPANRKGALGSDATVGIDPPSTSRLDFGIIDISGGAANSVVMNSRIWFTADGGNTLVEDFELFLLAAENGFTSASTYVYMTEEGLASSTEGAGTYVQLYAVNAVVGSYSWTELNPTEQGARNLRPPDDGTSMVLSTTSDDAIMWANYIAVGSDELTGTYKDLDSGKEFRYSLTYSYS